MAVSLSKWVMQNARLIAANLGKYYKISRLDIVDY